MKKEQKITLAVIQDRFSSDTEENIGRIRSAVVRAAELGAQVVLPPELFEGPYFCKEESSRYFQRAAPPREHPAVQAMQETARECQVVIPTSFFEKDGPHYYNSLAFIGETGKIQGIYRKSHIPDGPGYQEKFYFKPGNTGFKVWDTSFGRIGVGICWDQWFPECARAMMLMGADVLLYPTAIGTEPHEPDLDTRPLWMRAMIGHAVSNVVPIAAANRIGVEEGQTFYGSSFIADQQGEMVTQASMDQPEILTAAFDLDAIRRDRAAFGFFRDRRPEHYRLLSEQG